MANVDVDEREKQKEIKNQLKMCLQKLKSEDKSFYV